MDIFPPSRALSATIFLGIPISILCVVRQATLPMIAVLSCCMLLAAGGLAVSLFAHSHRYALYLMGTAVVLLVMGYQLVVVSVMSQPLLTMPWKRIVGVQGTVLADATVSSNANMVVQVRLGSSLGKDGSESVAAGMLTIVADEPAQVLVGMEVQAVGVFMEGDDGNLLFLADELVVSQGSWRLVQQVRSASIGWVQRRLEISQGSDVRTLALMLLLGRCDDSEFPLRDASRLAGCAHLLALSGMHLQVFASIARLLGSLVLGRRRGTWVGIAAVLLFLLVAGPKPSLLRSVLMFFLTLARLPIGYAYLGAFALQLLVAPYTIATVGSLFSYAALGGMLLLSAWASGQWSSVVGSPLAQVLSASAAALLLSAPCSMVVFGTWTPVGLLVAPVAGVAITLAMGNSLALLACGVGKVGVLDWTLQQLYAVLGWMLQWGADMTDRLPVEPTIWLFVGGASLLLTVTVCIGYAVCSLSKRRRNRHELELCIRFPHPDNTVAE